MFIISGGINCWDPVEDSDTGGPSSITVRMEYLRAFQYWYCELCLENRWGRKHCFVNFFLWRCLNLRWMRGGWVGQKVLFRASWNRSFSSRSFSHLNRLWFKCKTPLLFFLIIFYYISFDQQSSADVFQNRFLKNFANSTGKHLCWSPFSISFQAFTPATSLKRDSNTAFFLSN